jgi:hypothetical protein
MYIMIAPDSKTDIGAPPPFGLWSTMTGMRWVHFEEFGGELIAALDIAGNHLVLDSAFLEQDGNLLTVGGRPVVQIDHREALVVRS